MHPSGVTALSRSDPRRLENVPSHSPVAPVSDDDGVCVRSYVDVLAEVPQRVEPPRPFDSDPPEVLEVGRRVGGCVRRVLPENIHSWRRSPPSPSGRSTSTFGPAM